MLRHLVCEHVEDSSRWQAAEQPPFTRSFVREGRTACGAAWSRGGMRGRVSAGDQAGVPHARGLHRASFRPAQLVACASIQRSPVATPQGTRAARARARTQATRIDELERLGLRHAPRSARWARSGGPLWGQSSQDERCSRPDVRLSPDCLRQVLRSRPRWGRRGVYPTAAAHLRVRAGTGRYRTPSRVVPGTTVHVPSRVGIV